ncbi:MAG TPA: glycosyltransferase family 4 protein, partial [Opitutus sp.]|nr:glycosyltransferase family 4 protein [Opitutus sp.]
MNPHPITGDRRAVDDCPLARHRGARVACVIFSYYSNDPRPRRAAEALVRQGLQVDVICLREDGNDTARHSLNGVHLLRLSIRHRRGGKLAYFWQYASFMITAFLLLSWRSLYTRYRLVHAHNMPDLLVFCALIPKLRGARLILDLHDPMPELLSTIFGKGPESRAGKLLRTFERWSTRFADEVITVNEACRELFGSRSCPAQKIHVVMNSPDPAIFRFRQAESTAGSITGRTDRFVILYHGALVERNGLDLAIAALVAIKPHIPAAELRIIGRRTRFLTQMLDSPEARSCSTALQYLGEKTLEQVVEEIGRCCVGIIPNRRSPFTDINTPTRIFEFLSQGKPVIAPRTRGILDYFGPDELIFFEVGNVEDLSRQIVMVWQHPDLVQATVVRGQRVCQAHAWDQECAKLTNLVARLLDTGR